MMMKHNWKPGNMIYPLPAVLVTCGSVSCMDGHFVCVSADVLHFGTAGAVFLPDYSTEHGVRDQSHDERHGVCHRLVWRAFGEGLQQVRGDAPDTGKSRGGQGSDYRGIARLD